MQPLPHFTKLTIQLLGKKKGKGRHLIYNTKVVTYKNFRTIHHIEAS